MSIHFVSANCPDVDFDVFDCETGAVYGVMITITGAVISPQWSIAAEFGDLKDRAYCDDARFDVSHRYSNQLLFSRVSWFAIPRLIIDIIQVGFLLADSASRYIKPAAVMAQVICYSDDATIYEAPQLTLGRTFNVVPVFIVRVDWSHQTIGCQQIAKSALKCALTAKYLPAAKFHDSSLIKTHTYTEICANLRSKYTTFDIDRWRLGVVCDNDLCVSDDSRADDDM